MNMIQHVTGPLGGPIIRCPALADAVGDIADVAVAELAGGVRVLGVRASCGSLRDTAAAGAGGIARRAAVVPCSPSGPALRLAEGAAGGGADPGMRWAAFRCTCPGGTSDLAVLRLVPGTTEDVARDRLGRVWPHLRPAWDGIRPAPAADAADADALLEIADDLIPTAILLVDRSARLRCANRAGLDVLAAGAPLAVADGRLTARSERDTRALRAGIAAAAEAGAETGAAAPEPRILVVADADPAVRRPVWLAPCRPDPQGAPRVAVLVSMPPSPAALRRIGRALGLSATEARISVLLEAGLPNREAAQRAGLKEQTFATYTKRILGKLDAGGRAELAHRLTWQASGTRT